MDVAVPLPHPRWRLPVLGDLLGVSPDHQIEHAVRLARQLGPIYVRKIFNQTVVFVSGPGLAAELVDEKRFAKHVAPTIVALRPLIGDGLFTAYNDEPNLHAAYQVLTPAFSQAAMRGYHATMVQVIRELLDRWDAGAESDVVSDMTKLTLEIIGRTGFGYSFDSFDRPTPHPFVAAMIRSLVYAQRSMFRPPVIGRLTGWRADRRNRADIAYLNAVVDEVVRTRGRDGDGDDMLALMLRSPLDEVNIRHQIITFLAGGHETTASMLSFALHSLSTHPDVLARARAEVDAVCGAGDPAFEHVGKLRYVRRIVDESLRLWPTAPAFAREARADTTLGDGLRLRRGEWVLVLTAALQRDPGVWGVDADEFNPDHFAPEAAKRRPKHAFMPFGTGMRACIGRQFAVHEGVLALAMLIRRYDLRPRPGYRLRVRELLTLKPEGLFLTPERR
ncbi:cytochrome P450 [Actinoplanes siamensis]|uniref:Cytochrome P450 n=1 Tax=Actinoplanes siamensis TaxID=1223317 RepID=A0A919NA99_9ACTN|nr:cytochrome P450 [Actinoplanes siamensis]GIF07110.1 cytochrome P450 [Actinoplanes siamensis]